MSEPDVHNGQDNEAETSDTMNMNDQIEPQAEVLNEVSRQLMEARIGLGLSEEDIAGKLFLNPSRIRYIDSGQFSKIGKPAFLKGYLRSYAREVGLSPDAIITLLNELDNHVQAPQERLSRVSEHRSHSINTTPAATTAIIGIIGVAVVLLVIWWFNPQRQESVPVLPEVGESQDEGQQIREYTTQSGLVRQDPELMSADSESGSGDEKSELPSDRLTSEASGSTPGDSSQDESVNPLSGPVTTDTSRPEASTLSSGEEDQVTALATGPEDSTVEDSEPGVEPVQIERYEEGDWQVVTVSANGEDHLKFTFTDDCWLEVVDALGRPVYGDLNHERERLSVYGNAPFRVLIGRVSAVTVSFNEKPVDLKAYAFNDTAKLVIE